MNTNYSKGKASSMSEPDANGKAWQITTWKNSRGEVECTAVQGTLSEGIFSYELFGSGNKRLTLANELGIATASRIQSVHERGLVKFEQIQQETPPVYVIAVGQILKGRNSHFAARVIYEIPKPGTYLTVTLDGKILNYEQHLHTSDYTEGEVMPLEEIPALVEAAKELKAKESQERQEKERIETERREKGKAWFHAKRPAWAKAFIVAELEKNTSDPMTDYFGSVTERRLLLAWSATDRNDFNEMREAARNAEETLHLAERNEKLEHRENFTGGGGYWLGEHRHSGWQISKRRIDQYLPTFNVEDFRVKDQPAPTTFSGAAIEGDKIATCKINNAKGGIELYFPGKPAASVLDDLKANGFRWSKFNKCWYKLDNAIARKVAAKYADIPQSLNATERIKDAQLVDTQEQAAIANGNY